jgi:hypothetical protein
VALEDRGPGASSAPRALARARRGRRRTAGRARRAAASSPAAASRSPTTARRRLHWSGFAPASLVVPEVALARRGEEVWCTVAALARGDDLPDELLELIELRLAGCGRSRCRCLIRIPTERHRVAARWRRSTTRRPSRAPSS